MAEKGGKPSQKPRSGHGGPRPGSGRKPERDVRAIRELASTHGTACFERLVMISMGLDDTIATAKGHDLHSMLAEVDKLIAEKGHAMSLLDPNSTVKERRAAAEKVVAYAAGQPPQKVEVAADDDPALGHLADMALARLKQTTPAPQTSQGAPDD